VPEAEPYYSDAVAAGLLIELAAADSSFEDAVLVEAGKSAVASMVAAEMVLLLEVRSFGR
jgi:hypothetical protein